MVLKVMKNMDLHTDGSKVADSFRKLAEDLRDSWRRDGDGSFEGMFDWAEFADTSFARRERVVKVSERSG